MKPLIVEFEVAASIDHAFDVWTARPSLWWPRSHTVTKDPAAIVFEPFAGGRIFERAADGEEHDWGEILSWEPPARLTYLWHLFFSRDEATEVAITFVEEGGSTRVRIEQTGFERLGEPTGIERRTRTQSAWTALAGMYAEACST